MTMQRTASGRPVRGGFTLVELLVVIGIIALLISILLPSLNRAREQAKSIKCLSNLRQLGIAIGFYTSEFKAQIPACWDTASPALNEPGHSNRGYTWVNILADLNYLKGAPEAKGYSSELTAPPLTSGAYFCPSGVYDIASDSGSFPNPLPAADAPICAKGFRTYSVMNKRWMDAWYGINGSTQEMTPLGMGGYTGGAGYKELPTRGYPANTNTTLAKDYSLQKVSAIKKSSEVVLLFDGFYMNASTGSAGQNAAFRINGRHINRKYTNLLMCDGHAEAALRTELPMKDADFTIANLSQPPLNKYKWRIDQ